MIFFHIFCYFVACACRSHQTHTYFVALACNKIEIHTYFFALACTKMGKSHQAIAERAWLQPPEPKVHGRSGMELGSARGSTSPGLLSRGLLRKPPGGGGACHDARKWMIC
jgi:hypothetical protein